MENKAGEGLIIASEQSAPLDLADHPSTAVGSHDAHAPLSDEDQEHEVPQEESKVSAEDLRKKIIKQVEYYFSDENLPNDKYLMSLVRKNKDGFVPIGIIASFRKMKKLTRDFNFIVSALRESSVLVLSSDGKKVKRLHPLPITEVKDPKLCTVLVENLPEDHSVENIQGIFGQAGAIKNIQICDPHAMGDSKGSKAEKLFSGKLHALVEYENVEAADKAAATLNNEQDWRNGMRVRLLKNAGKYAPRKPGWRGPDSEMNTAAVQSSDQVEEGESHNSSEHHENIPEADGDNLSKEKNGHRGRNQGRSRKHKYRGMSGQGHGTTNSAHGVEISKPPPGPRMPDGTRGFTMGRGRPPVSNQG